VVSASILRARVLSCVAPASCPCPCVLAILRACAGVLACLRAVRARARGARLACVRASACARARMRAACVRARTRARNARRARGHARVRAVRARVCACCVGACVCVRVMHVRVCARARAPVYFFSGQTPARENSMGLGPRVWHSKGTRRGPAGSSDNIIALAHPQPVPKFRSPLAAPPPAGDGAPGPALDTARRIPKEAQAVPGVHWQPNPNAAEQLASLLNRKHLGPPVAT